MSTYTDKVILNHPSGRIEISREAVQDGPDHVVLVDPDSTPDCPYIHPDMWSRVRAEIDRMMSEIGWIDPDKEDAAKSVAGDLGITSHTSEITDPDMVGARIRRSR